MKEIPKALSSALPAVSSNGRPSISCRALILMAVCLFAGCTTGPPQTANPNPASTSFMIKDLVTNGHLDNINESGLTRFINAGDNYAVTFQATSLPVGLRLSP
jgi:hypothetical protein